MIELVEKRRENTKTFDLGGHKRQLISHIGAIHYKDNYADKSEQWKDINLTWESNKITRAPYELTLDGQKLTIKDKKFGEVSIIELMSVFPAGISFEVLPENSAVRFQHILSSDKIPFEAKFKVTGKGLITTRAFDDDGELVLDVSLVGDTLIEKLSEVRDKQTGRIRPAKGNIRIDPTWQVGASYDDILRAYTPSENNILSTRFIAGYDNNIFQGWGKDYGSAARFLNVTIPAGSTITLANLILTCKNAGSLATVNTRLRAQANINPATFSNDAGANFDARTWTDEFVNWDAIPAWSAEEEGADTTSPDIKTCIQEVIDLVGWASGNPIVILWDDFEKRSTQADGRARSAYSYDGSTTKAPKLLIDYIYSWKGKISGVTNPAKIMGVDVANIAKVKGVTTP